MTETSFLTVVCTHYPRNQAAINALASQCIYLQHEIQADFVGAKCDVHGVLGQMEHSPCRLPGRSRGEMANAERYCETLQKLRRVIQNKRRGIVSAGVVLLHDNARPHAAGRPAHLLQEFSWEVLNYSPYSPNLIPSDFHLFLHLKKFLSGQRLHFQNDREAEMSVTQCSGFNPRRQTSTTQDTKVGPTV